MRLFWDRGYEGTSLEALTEAMSLSPSSLYATFGGKEPLFLECIDRYLQGPGSFAAGILEKTPSARAAIGNLLIAAANELTRADQPRGCMLTQALMNCNPEAEAIRGGLQARRRETLQIITARIQRGMDAGELPVTADAAELGAYFTTVLQGMSVQARDGATAGRLLAVAHIAMRAWPR